MATNNSWNNQVLANGSILNGGTVSIGTDTGNTDIDIGTATTAGRDITIGNITGTTELNLYSGTDGLLVVSTGDIDVSGAAISIDASGVLELNSSAGVIGIGNDAVAQNINIGTGAAARAVTVGNNTGATSVSVDIGTGDFDLTSGSGTVINALDSGEVLMPMQPAFSAKLSPGVTNQTGDTTVYTVIYNSATINVGSCYNTTTGVFTAPVSGTYLFIANFILNGVTASHTFIRTKIVGGSMTSNRDWGSPAVILDSNSKCNYQHTAILSVAAAASVYVTIQVNNGAKVVGVGANDTQFAGVLLC